MNSLDDLHQRPIVSVDLAIFALAPNELEVLLAQRGTEPFAGSWALPGGWIHVDEDRDLEAAAQRVLHDKTGVAAPYFEQVGVFGDAARDPRGWSLSVTYMALIAKEAVTLKHGGNVTGAAWHPIGGHTTTVPLAFDHAAILKAAITRLRNKVEYTTLPVHLLPEAFTLSELQAVYERLLGRLLDKSAFRKRIAEVDFVEPIAGEMRRASNRPAQLYRLKQARSTVFFDRTI
ncbi:NUDIX hydrolase [Rhizobium sp. BR 314]|uniref:NUDIX hydrolase n=1 Tax=Rhizobium sp. BR 314 TaxID=3040013 RepID=UPI0039BF54A3